VRKALEEWPLLAETQTVVGTTSTRSERFTSMNAKFPCALSFKEWIAGLPYRKSVLYPSLHLQIGVQLPLSLWVVNRESEQVEKTFTLLAGRTEFVEEPPSDFKPGKPCEPATAGMYTCDLRIK
jgi:hypothetical protein